MNPLIGFFRSKKRRNRLLLVSGAVVLLAALLTVLLHACAAEQTDTTPAIPSNELLINDLYEGKKLIPKYSIAKNTYVNSKFSKKNGLLSYADKNAVRGIDVSEWQGNINWKKVKAAGIDFAIVRVGYRGQTVGKIFADKKFQQNMTGASAAGVELGVYFYSQAVTKAEAEEEAAYVLQKIAPYKLKWPVAFDWEPGEAANGTATGSTRTDPVTPTQVTQFVKAFCSKIQAYGYQPCFYTNKNMGYATFNLKALEAYPMWYAEYQDLPSFYYHFDLWQYASKGKVNGISNTVDLNIAFRHFS
ncbi:MULTISPECIES: glycoside hydrolase family 25 protein [Caproicibacterium]|uniref:Glycoside hydrolase family 25 protein n=1 Tax=Caproicibacterium argilliputei TaxID=3030016 RepID=A0AA97D9A7_9FIRM|nr:glycoside hydrolase family 25 protein [Caproicibacterium argilliputei]WOC31420.1 glycoside hydrolase family 25 protein [Caproicibacterium argilliputei]